MIDKKLLEIIACPSCKGNLDYDKSSNKLVCKKERLCFPIEDGIPVLLIEEAQPLAE
jgi:uncharacterized protein YbaR (Trm112 family)